MRVYEFARNYEITSKELVGICQELGISVKAQSKLDETQLATLSRHFSREEDYVEREEEMIENEESTVEMEMDAKGDEIVDQQEEGLKGRKLAYIVTECEPFTSLGELGKISADFAKNMVSEGHSLIVALPKYKEITDAYGKEMDWLMDLPIRVGYKNIRVSLFKLVFDSVTYLFIGNDGYFHREAIYGYEDDVERFAFFNRAVLEALPYLGEAVEEIHLNDWHTSMIPLMLEVDYKHRPFYEGVETILTIHNLEYQGWCEAEVLPSILGISRQYYENGLTRMGDAVNLLKSGIETAHQIRLQGMSQNQMVLPQIQQSGMATLIENKLNHQVA